MTNPPVCVVDESQGYVVEVGALVIDTKAYDVTDNGVPITLKPREYALLLALARGAREVTRACVAFGFRNKDRRPYGGRSHSTPTYQTRELRVAHRDDQ